MKAPPYNLFLASTNFCETLIGLSVRWVQPSQQQGRRIPPFILDSAFSIRMPLVSAFTPEMTQHIHSLRARGVMSSHNANTFGLPEMDFRKSAGRLCTVPEAIVFLTIR